MNFNHCIFKILRNNQRTDGKTDGQRENIVCGGINIQTYNVNCEQAFKGTKIG